MHDVIERDIHGPDHKKQALASAVRVVGHDEVGASVGSQREPVGEEPSTLRLGVFLTA